MESAQQLGQRGEELAACYLEDQGYVIVDRNWRCSAGELDIVALYGRTLIAVEVKTRRSLAHGRPMEAITPAKSRRLRRLLHAWRSEKEAHPQAVRIDAVLIIDSGDDIDIEHRQGIA